MYSKRAKFHRCQSTTQDKNSSNSFLYFNQSQNNICKSDSSNSEQAKRCLEHFSEHTGFTKGREK